MGVLVLDAGPTRAFTISTIFTAGCHEMITTDALRAVRAELSTAEPLPTTANERALIDDLPFSRAPDMTDLGGASLLVGVRDNDLEGRDPSDLSQLALVHGNPSSQRRHCLHGSHQAEPGGSEAALLDCRAFIVEGIGEALDGLDAAGRPDPARRTSLPLYLALRHHVDASLPTYYVRIGQVVHAVEDLFSHTYRTTDEARVTAVMNWVDQANGHLNEATDGPPHATEFDRCDDPDDLRAARRMLATQAATEVLRITLDPRQSRAQKTAGVAVLLDRWLGYSPGCSAANGWCSAPERHYGDVKVLGCDVSAGDRGHWGSAVSLALLALVARGRRGRRPATATIGAALITLLAGPARAEMRPPAATAAAAHVPPPVTTPVGEPGPLDRSRPALGAYVGGSGSVTDAALAATLGVRLRATLHWTFGLDGEWNPWVAINSSTHLRAGALNAYGTVIFRMPLAYETFNLRVTGNLGVSRTLMDLYGVPNGTMGLYAGLSPLGIEWKASRRFYVVVNPLSVAVPVPQLGSIPFLYPQYRASIGLEFYGH